jgi:hypothetical protein
LATFWRFLFNSYFIQFIYHSTHISFKLLIYFDC